MFAGSRFSLAFLSACDGIFLASDTSGPPPFDFHLQGLAR